MENDSGTGSKSRHGKTSRWEEALGYTQIDQYINILSSDPTTTRSTSKHYKKDYNTVIVASCAAECEESYTLTVDNINESSKKVKHILRIQATHEQRINDKENHAEASNDLHDLPAINKA